MKEEQKIWVAANKDPFKFNGIQFSKKPIQVKNEPWIRSLLNESKSSSIKKVNDPKKKVKKESVRADNTIKGGK